LHAFGSTPVIPSEFSEAVGAAQVSGEDLTPYREASKYIWGLLQRYGPVQRGGMDEAFVDVTDEVCELKGLPYCWARHLSLRALQFCWARHLPEADGTSAV
jgi:hypothetical protein